VPAGWNSLLEGTGRERLESIYLRDYLPKQRWFAGKSRHIAAAKIMDWAELQRARSALALVEVQFDSGPPETYQLPLAMTFGEAGEEVRKAAPNVAVAAIHTDGLDGLLHDGLFDDQACAKLFSLIEQSGEIPSHHGLIQGVRGSRFQEILGSNAKPLSVRRGSAEQSNTSILIGDRFILKLFRRLESGLNPDCEIGRYLSESANFAGVAPFAGSIEAIPGDRGESSTLAMLQGLVANEGDGWKWTVEELDRYYEACAAVSFPENALGETGDSLDLSERPASQLARDHVGIYLKSAAALGRRTAELHLALASAAGNPNFAPEPLTSDDLQAQLADARQHATAVFGVLKERVSHLPDEVVELAASVLSRRRRILDYLGNVKFEALRAQRIRIHGDYHLGQVLRVKTDFVILDFEGEPARSLAYRRTKQSPLKDVAGMLRSFSYAAHGTLINYAARHPENPQRLEPWAQLWERSVAAEFLRSYRETAATADFLPARRSDFRKLLGVFLLDKALYEILYEMNSRPGWVRIPMMGLLSLPL
jgi:maltose alpha-D-glucosyltransferase/alpha-amylase